MKIFLIGYMGSGKSMIARPLAKKMNSVHIDLDDHIALLEEQKISKIFENKGELYFRKLESRVLQDMLEEPSSMVVALGGGTPCYGNNLKILKEFPRTKTVYLKASVAILTKRLYSEFENRPVISHLKTRENLEDFIRKHLFERGFYYNQADVIVNVDDKEPGAIVSEILQKLK